MHEGEGEQKRRRRRWGDGGERKAGREPNERREGKGRKGAKEEGWLDEIEDGGGGLTLFRHWGSVRTKQRR